MKHPTECKFCKKPILLAVDDNYDISDPQKLFPLAACNQCADLREKRRYLEDSIRRIASNLMQADPKSLPAISARVREPLTILTKRYTAMIAEWVHSATPAWDSEVVETIIDKPKRWADALGVCWKMYEDVK